MFQIADCRSFCTFYYVVTGSHSPFIPPLHPLASAPPSRPPLQSGLSKGVGVGAIFGTMFCAWALTFWYSSVLVAASSADAGTILTTMFAVLIGGV